ncbi:uncharacterized protein EV420DRAFT_1700105 [Desarmillaria tabescens]|uniref:Uncharacterized protein n=1 Tax=Armillaria tabescens TaxID=1929756 RepID=A0AA39TZ03_ARMTA|nr:uncharacterized protein EV420DRAFT_1700105 [Desarmillaria tabescens]KAK0467159.1 hypothetical protein EV420DRAFT_1700105 [Desarmillaria tabescens]
MAAFLRFKGINNTVAAHVSDVLQISAAAGFLLVVLTAVLSRHVQRHFTWLNFCVSWIISCISYTLLVFTGNGSKHAPPFELCVVQAALIYGAPVLTGGTTFSLAFYMYTHVKSTLDNASLGGESFWVSLVADFFLFIALGSLNNSKLVLGPYLIWLGFFIGVLVSGIRQPSLVRKASNYCDFTSRIPSKASALVVALAVMGVITVSIRVTVRLYRNRRRLGHDTLYVTTAIRVMLFALICFLAFVVSAVYIITWSPGPEFDIILALVPNFGVIIFGSQADILRAWIALLKRAKAFGNK